MRSFTLEREVDLPASRFWAIITDFNRSPGPHIETRVEIQGDARGVGTVRTIRIGFIKARETLLRISDPDSFSYRLETDGFTSYVGEVVIKPKGDKAAIFWKVDYEPKYPGTAWLISVLAKRTLNFVIDDVLAGSARSDV